MKELFENIRQWASDRNIILGARTTDQFAKLQSEFGELCLHLEESASAFSMGSMANIAGLLEDDIGDCLVVLTIIAAQINMEIEHLIDADTVEVNYQVPMIGVLRFAQTTGKLGDCLLKGQFVEAGVLIGIAANYLSFIAVSNGLDVEACLESAYNDIKDRKGVMYNGVFVKESDPAYEGVLAQVKREQGGSFMAEGV